jgi:hypothetical protein
MLFGCGPRRQAGRRPRNTTRRCGKTLNVESIVWRRHGTDLLQAHGSIITDQIDSVCETRPGVTSTTRPSQALETSTGDGSSAASGAHQRRAFPWVKTSRAVRLRLPAVSMQVMRALRPPPSSNRRTTSARPAGRQQDHLAIARHEGGGGRPRLYSMLFLSLGNCYWLTRARRTASNTLQQLVYPYCSTGSAACRSREACSSGSSVVATNGRA